ncbi:phage integrase N-terminal SAM-like domain-containing protein [Actinokineospora enzanensis]|uniref:phage integrase N-terminal SAM-like domain-containing protein n=1 Tax=Actinokineospora enzanensis TaxID=155975 RepID=UPI000477CF97
MAVTCTNAPVWAMLCELWETSLASKGRSEHTIGGYLRTARRWARWLEDQGYDVDPNGVTTFHVELFIVGIIKATSAANAAHHYRNLRVLFKWLVKRKHISAGNQIRWTRPSHRALMRRSPTYCRMRTTQTCC